MIMRVYDLRDSFKRERTGNHGGSSEDTRDICPILCNGIETGSGLPFLHSSGVAEDGGYFPDGKL
jgi:hypothetical protein